MITTKDIESIGWCCIASSPNGGTKAYSKGNSPLIIESSADNFIYQLENDPRINLITIENISNKSEIVYEGYPGNISELEDIIKSLNIS